MLGDTRTDVQCLHRWNKVLKPGLLKGPWTEEEDTIVTQVRAGARSFLAVGLGWFWDSTRQLCSCCASCASCSTLFFSSSSRFVLDSSCRDRTAGDAAG